MRIALFASGPVGLRIAEFLGGCATRQRSGEPVSGGPVCDGPVCLVLDANGPPELNERIVEASGLGPDRVIETCRATRDALPAELSRFAPDLCVLAWWPYLIDRATLAVPRVGCLNFHPSLLPHGRGKAPNFWSIVDGTPFGVTIHWVDEGIDSGDVAFQRELPVGWADTGETLYRWALDEIVSLFIDSYPRIVAGDIPRLPQPDARCRYQRELDAASRIDLDRSYAGRELLDLIRARTFPPHPAAWFEEAGVRYEVRIDIRPVADEQESAASPQHPSARDEAPRANDHLQDDAA